MKNLKHGFSVLLVLSMLFLLVGCSGASAPTTTAGQNAAVEETVPPKTYNILFIGNSYTYYNDMPTAIFQQFAQAGGYDVEVTAITKGSYRLEAFADPNDAYGAQVEQALTGEKQYDFVILQEQSSRPANNNADLFYAAVRNLSAQIRAHGAVPILYSTWGWETGRENLETNGWTNETMTWKLAASYQAIGDELQIPVSHVGLAFYDIYTGDSGIDIYHTDKTHPSYAGSYLVAATLYATIFEADPTSVAFNGSLPAEDAAILRETAKMAVFETPAIPSEYVITSEGR